MKNLRSLQGGYPRQMDYILTLQNEYTTVVNSMFSKLGQDLVLSGCDVTDNGNGTVNISAGILFVSSEVVRFDGAANIASNQTKTFVKDAPVATDPKTFGDGVEKQVYTEVKVIIGDKTSALQVGIGTVLYTLATYIQDVAGGYAVKGEYKEIYDFDGTFLNNFDASGLGITARYLDWALDNGNNGTPGSAGRVIVGTGRFTDPVTGAETNFASGDKGGEAAHKLTIAEMPKHGHGYSKMRQSNNVDGGSNTRYGELQDATTTTAGDDQARNNMQPYVAAYRIIKIR